MGIEPTYLAWKASVLPLNYTRISMKFSAQNRNRTSDTRIFSPLLYQLSYLGILLFFNNTNDYTRLSPNCQEFFSVILLLFTRLPANAGFCAKRRKINFSVLHIPASLWITFTSTLAHFLSSDFSTAFPYINAVFTDFSLLSHPVIHTHFFKFSTSSQSFCQYAFCHHSLFFVGSFIIKL